MIAIDLGHRFGHVARVGSDGRPEVTTTELAGVDGVLDPVRALPRLFGPAQAMDAEPDRAALLGLPVSGGREEELRYAVERAGLDVVRVVPDPVAVAVHYGAVAEGVDHTVLVCDQGATTLDLSVLAIAPDLTVHVVRSLSLRLGGDDWDAAVAAGLTGRLPEGVDPLRAAEVLRRALGDSDGVTETVEDATGGRHPLTLDRAACERAVAALRERTLAAVAEELTAVAPAVDTVLLAGGMCAAPGLRSGIEALPAARGLTVRRDRPEAAVVLGLLALHDFGLLRVVTGPAARPGRTKTGYAGPGTGCPPAEAGRLGADAGGVLPDPEPGRRQGDATDPEPRTGRPLPEDPEPGPRRSGAPGVPQAGQAGREGDFRPPEPEDAERPRPEPPHAGAPQAPYAEPSYARPSYTRPYPEHSRPPYTEDPETGPAYEDPETGPGSPEAPEPPTPPGAPGAGSVPGPPAPSGSDPYDTTATAPTGSPADPRPLFAVPVDQLQAVRRGTHLLVLWAWPDGALSARVRWRGEGSTAGAGPGDGDVVCRRRVYEHDGGFDVAVGHGAVTLTVEALVAEGREDREGASSLLVSAAPPVVAYEPSVRRRLRGRVASVVFTSETGCDLPGLRIVHGLGRFRPTSTAEGTVLHEVPAQRLSAGTPLTVEFPLPATRGPSWLVCFPADADAGADSGIDIRPTALHRLRVT